MYLIFITNIGFEERIWNNLENNINKKTIIIDIIILGSILVFFL